MGHHDLRHDNECQNCGYTVEVEYCSKCGQKNTETRQSFTHLAAHFAEDLTHYDGAFWKTLKYLIFRPGKLTIEYLEGHRMRYVPPVKLYIFVSFVTFILISLLSNTGSSIIEVGGKTPSKILKENGISFRDDPRMYHSLKEYDSIKKNKEGNFILRWLDRTTLKVSEKDINGSQFADGIIHTMPKVLFIYMPIFAFWLWLFHGKKRWMFFDHGIYTLHYFSFLLILTTIKTILGYILGFTNETFATIVILIYGLIALIYSIFYFFRSHSKMYGERKAISRLKVILLFFINFVCLIIATLALFFYVVLNTH